MSGIARRNGYQQSARRYLLLKQNHAQVPSIIQWGKPVIHAPMCYTHAWNYLGNLSDHVVQDPISPSQGSAPSPYYEVRSQLSTLLELMLLVINRMDALSPSPCSSSPIDYANTVFLTCVWTAHHLNFGPSSQELPRHEPLSVRSPGPGVEGCCHRSMIMVSNSGLVKRPRGVCDQPNKPIELQGCLQCSTPKAWAGPGR